MSTSVNTVSACIMLYTRLNILSYYVLSVTSWLNGVLQTFFPIMRALWLPAGGWMVFYWKNWYYCSTILALLLQQNLALEITDKLNVTTIQLFKFLPSVSCLCSNLQQESLQGDERLQALRFVLGLLLQCCRLPMQSRLVQYKLWTCVVWAL